MKTTGGSKDGWPLVGPEQLWDLFVEWLAREARDGRAADVVIPSILQVSATGKRLADLTVPDIDALAAFGAELGRDPAPIVTLWIQTRIDTPRQTTATRSAR